MAKRASSAGATVQGIRITRPDRLVLPGSAVTKLEVARYYEAVAAWMQPHVCFRPLMVLRRPDRLRRRRQDPWRLLTARTRRATPRVAPGRGERP